jgi:glycosyltransferase involved in cell wall biosynthesis
LKILITVGIFPPDIGGPASFVPKIAKLLQENGFEVTIICLSNEKIVDNESYKIIRILRNQNLMIRWIKTIFKMISNGRNADTIFVNGLPMEAYIANLFLRKKLIRKVVGDWAWERGRNKGIIDDSFDEFQKNKHNLHLEIAKFSRGWTATKADLVITPSVHLKNVVKNWGVSENNLKVIYNGTKIQSKITKKENEVLHFITVGRLAPWKNIDKIIQAMAILNEKGFNFIFNIVGSGPLNEKLKILVKELKLENKIFFLGQKNTEELNKIYLDSDIYIQASGYEGLPHVILEAINFNLSIISTPIGGTNEILLDGKNGWILKLKDKKAPDEFDLQEIIYELVDNKTKSNNLIHNAKEYLIENFDEDKNLNKYIELFKQ